VDFFVLELHFLKEMTEYAANHLTRRQAALTSFPLQFRSLPTRKQ
jgi:hypothetical protein